MENVMRKKNFQAFIKAMHILSKIFLIGCSIAVCLFIAIIAIIGLTPSEKIIALLEKGEIQAGLNFAGVHIELSEQLVLNFHFAKQPMLILMALIALYTVLFWLLIYCVQCMLKGIRNNQIFTIKNSKYIEWMAYSIMLMSFLLHPIQTWMISSFGELFQLMNVIKNSEWIQSISYDYFSIHWSLLFSGMIIWIIGRTFRYGAFLQEEFDATL